MAAVRRWAIHFNENRWEVHNYTTSTMGAHVSRAGVRVRGTHTFPRLALEIWWVV